MKILVISHMYPSPMNQISGIFVHQQVKELLNLGHEVKVVSPKPLAPFPFTLLRKKWKEYSNIPKHITMDNVEVYYPRYLEFPRSYTMDYSGDLMYKGIKQCVKKIYKDFPFEVIHAHVALPDGYTAIKLKSIYNKPAVVTIHGQDLQHTLFRNKKSKEKLGYVIQSADQIVTVSSKLKRIALHHFEEVNELLVVNNGISAKEVIVAPQAKKRSSNLIRILSVSNLVNTKGIDLNLKALAKLKLEFPNIRYTIVGDGPERAHIESLIEALQLRNFVQILGKLDHRQAMEQMVNADIFSLPSWKEGFGMVYIEAMANGLPVIGVKGEGITDVIQDGVTGILVEPKDIDSLASAMKFLITDPEWRTSIGMRAKELVLKDYTWEQNARKMDGIYTKLTRDKEYIR